MKTCILSIVGTASLIASADAGFLGFVASVRTSGAYTVIDVFAACGNSSDKYLNTYDLNGSTTIAGGFYQAAGLTNKTWKPDAAGFVSSRDSIDSFMTAGTYSGGAYAGVYYASSNTNADPNFLVAGNYWSATPGSAPATTIPALAGWYTGDPTSIDNKAESLAGLVGRVNSTGTLVGGGAINSATANWGIWCGHLVVAGTAPVVFGNGGNMFWTASQSIKDGVNGSTSQGISTIATVPAPGAFALLGLAGFASRRRRA